MMPPESAPSFGSLILLCLMLLAAAGLAAAPVLLTLAIIVGAGR